MKPEKALELVTSYAMLTKAIKEETRQIGENLEQCTGVKGDRKAVDSYGCPSYRPELDEKNQDKGLHIWGWYRPEYTGDGYYTEGRLVWDKVTADDHGQQCPHCYAAHLAIQNRKSLKKQLGTVKRSISRSVA